MATTRTSAKTCNEHAAYLRNEFGVAIDFYKQGDHDATRNVYVMHDGEFIKFRTNRDALKYMLEISDRLEAEEMAAGSIGQQIAQQVEAQRSAITESAKQFIEETEKVEEPERKKTFAETIIDGMVDENGHCGERGLSKKQFDIIAAHLTDTDWEYVDSWRGNYGVKEFFSKDYDGNVGRYHVVLNWYAHFNDRYTVKSIDLRDPEEFEAELREERRLRELRDFSGSEYVSQPKKRLDLELTLVNDYVFSGVAYNYYDDGTRHIYTFRDEDGNCLVWKTSKAIECFDEERGQWAYAEVGDTVSMRATVKGHSEYRDTKQTVITRPKVLAIA